MCKETTGETVGKVRAIADMHQRKAEMAHHLNCFIAPSGGYGTLEELLEVITWAQLGIHDKLVGLLNVDGYENYLITFIDKAVDDGFIKPSQHHIIVFAPNARELIQKLEEYVHVHCEIVAAPPLAVQSRLLPISSSPWPCMATSVYYPKRPSVWFF